MELIFGGEAVLDFCICNAWKYIWRWKNKNGREDLSKAEWYIKRAFKYSYNISTEDHDILCRMRDYVTDVPFTESEEERNEKVY